MNDVGLAATLDALFVAQARRTPDRVALVCGGLSVSFDILEQRSNAVARALSARGIGCGAIVAIRYARSTDWIVALLGVLRSGATALPLPPDYPPARTRAILGGAKVAAVLAGENAEEIVAPVLDVKEVAAEHTGGPLAPPPPPDPDRPALVLCSSGSTGTPKMIVRSHRSFMHRLRWTWYQHPFEPGEHGCHKAPTTTTHGVYELFEPLLAGAPVVVLDDTEVRDLERFWLAVRAHSVSRMLLVPSAMRASLALPGFVPPPLKVLVLMGEHLPAPLARRVIDAFPPTTRVYSIYGSTEASSVLVCDVRHELRGEEELPLGVPISSEIGAHVLGPDLRPTPPAAVGRLYIEGPALFSGYLGQPDLTARVLLRAPDTGALLYDTRDDVRRIGADRIMFVGRADDTVKIRGFRVELTEVERALYDCPGVTQAAVVVDDEEPDAKLIGFYTPRAVSPQTVFRALKERLAPQMLPSAVVGLDAFPVTDRAKLDRRRLLAEYRAGAPIDLALTETQRRIAQVWESTLAHRRFASQQSFFEVGGTSLTAAVLVHKLREEFGLSGSQLPQNFPYQHPTITAMARALENPACVADANQDDYLVTLRAGRERGWPTLFLIASAGGTVGAYRKLVAALRYGGDIVGVRDPFLTGAREPTEGFDAWVDRYLRALRRREPNGPYLICAYSSAGAFGLELAQRLREGGAEVALLALIDPLGIEGDRPWRFGRWVWSAAAGRPRLAAAVRVLGWLRQGAAPALRLLARRRPQAPVVMDRADFEAFAQRVRCARGHAFALAALLELNSGLPVDLSDAAVPLEPSDAALRALQARVGTLMPEFDAEAIERLAIQYELQAQMHRAYRLRPCEAPVVLAEPVSPYAGLLQLQLQPLLPRLRALRLPLGAPDARTDAITCRFGPLAAHFRSMRDATFIAGLAEALDQFLLAALRGQRAAAGSPERATSAA
jgi:amino acid adenylation domain-containing protein